MSVSAIAMSILQQMATTGTAYLTAEQGQELIDGNLITVDASQPNPENPQAFLCTLTDAGTGLLTAPAAPAAPAAPLAPPAAAAPAPVVPAVAQPTAAPVVGAVRNDIVVPAIKRGVQSSGPRPEKYPFSLLTVIGQSFHVALTAGEDISKLARRVSTEASRANSESKVVADPPSIVKVEKRRMVKGEDGNPVLDAEGKKTYQKYTVDEQAMTQTKFFISRKVDAADPEGVGIRVFRVTEDKA